MKQIGASPTDGNEQFWNGPVNQWQTMASSWIAASFTNVFVTSVAWAYTQVQNPWDSGTTYFVNIRAEEERSRSVLLKVVRVAFIVLFFTVLNVRLREKESP